MIISLRGTNGSGKSHTVFQLMKKFDFVPMNKNHRGRPEYYTATLRDGHKLSIVGPYVASCGGCDAIQPYDLIWPIVDKLAKQTHVLFEGSLVSSGYGRIGKASESYGDEIVFAFMNTPVENCIEFVDRRRKERGDSRKFDPINLIKKYRAVQLSLANIRDNHNRTVFVVNYKKAVSQLLGILYGSINPKTQPKLDLQSIPDHLDYRKQ